MGLRTSDIAALASGDGSLVVVTEEDVEAEDAESAVAVASLTVSALTTYRFQAHFLWHSTLGEEENNGILVAVNLSGGSLVAIQYSVAIGHGSQAGGYEAISYVTTVAETFLGPDANTQGVDNKMTLVHGTVEVGGTGGELQLLVKPRVGNTAAVEVLHGCTFEAMPI